MRGEIEDSEYAMIFLRDITESKAETARRMQMASDNASMDLLIKSMVRLLDRFVVCDLENDRYRFYNLQGEMIYAPTGTYHDFVEQVAAKYKTLESLDTLDAIISPENIRKNLQGENDIYKFEYCSMDENTYKDRFLHSAGVEWHKAGQSAAGLYGCVAGEKGRDRIP